MELPDEIRNCIEKIQTQHFSNRNNEIITEHESESVFSKNYSVTITEKISNKRLHLFIKYLLKNQCTYQVERLEYFNNEAVFYGEISSCFLKLGNESVPLACVPKCFSLGNGDERFIVLENIKKTGYEALNIKQPLSLECMRTVVRRLGHFHAHSLAMKHRHPQLFKSATSKLRETVFHQHVEPGYRKLFLHAVHDVIRLARQSLPEGSDYVKKLCEFSLDVFDKMVRLAGGDAEDEEYRVVTHGDLWPNNMLFKEQEDNIIFMDFQGCRYTSPAHDLIFVLLVSIDQATRERHREVLIRTYHAALCETLQLLGCDPLRLFPYLALQSQIRKYARFAAAVALVGLPLYLDEGPTASLNLGDDAGTNMDVEDMEMLGVYVRTVYARKSMKCKNKMMEVLIDSVNEGWL